MSDDPLSFPCKRIAYNNREVPVLMQNENGPCPLLALSNVLLLRGSITIHADISTISFRDLTSLIAEYMLDRNSAQDVNQQQNLADVMKVFPKLNRGLDVNVRFDKVDGLEYTEDLLIFDLMHVRLLHGWIVDPQDTVTHSVLGRLTYNQLVEKVIEFQSPARPQAMASPAPAPPPPPPPPPPPQQTSPGVDDDELQAAIALSIMNAVSKIRKHPEVSGM